jgi:tetratricopeptide (TPR) repeat protein
MARQTASVRGLVVGAVVLALAWAAGRAAAPPQGLDPLRQQQLHELERRQLRAAQALQFEKVEELARQTLSLLERCLGPRHRRSSVARREVESWRRLAQLPAKDRPRVARALEAGIEKGDAAVALFNQGKHDQAQPLFDRALAIHREALGEDHPRTMTSYSGAAMCLHLRGKHEQARHLAQRALASSRKVLGDDHPDTGLACRIIADTWHAQGKDARAQPFYEKALACFRKALGEEARSTGLAFSNLAICLNAQGKFAQAQPLYEKALVIHRQALGEDHAETGTSYGNVAFNLQSQG